MSKVAFEADVVAVAVRDILSNEAERLGMLLEEATTTPPKPDIVRAIGLNPRRS